MESSKVHIIQEEKCSVSTITLRSDKILMVKPFKHIKNYSLKDLEEQYTIFIKITKGHPLPFYSDVSKLDSFKPAEKSFISKTMHHFASACAIKENSALIRFMVHSSMYIYKPQLPIKMFKTEEAAIQWLKSV